MRVLIAKHARDERVFERIPGYLPSPHLQIRMEHPWLHIQWSTFGAWLPGDPRGFRNHQHRVHSSGDYKTPPPRGEHTGLQSHARAIGHKPSVVLDDQLRTVVRDAIADKLRRMGVTTSCFCVSTNHVHLLVRLDPKDVNRQIGRLKRHSSHAIHGRVPGTVWAARCHTVFVKDDEHFQNVRSYILRHEQSESAEVWICDE